MGQTLQILDCLVIGSEPSGIWLLQHLRDLEARIPKNIKKPRMELKLGHMPLGTPKKTPLPSSIANRFGISLKDSYSVEVVTPERTFEWNATTLESLYPELAPLLRKTNAFTSEMKSKNESALRFVLRKYPEILGFAGGIWKIFGKAMDLHPELLVWNTIQLGSYGFWTPEVPKETLIENSQIEEIRYEKNAVTVKLHGGTQIHAKFCVLNISLEDAFFLKQQIKGLQHLLPEDSLDVNAFYPLTFNLAKEAVPSPLSPLSLFLDTEEIPDLADTWYLETNRDEGFLRAWVPRRNESSLESVLEGLREKAGKLFHYLPYLEKNIQSLYPSLGMESCYGEIERFDADSTLLRMKEYRMASTQIHSYLNHRQLRFLTPQYKCFLPYPYGALSEASQIARELLGWSAHRQATRNQHAVS